VLTRGLKTALKTGLVVLLLVTSGGMVRTEAAAPPAPSQTQTEAQADARANARTGAFAAALTAAVATGRGKARCNGISHREVKGTEPVYTRKKLARFRNSDTLCHGLWLPRPRRYFVPQGFARTSRNTAWISGFRHRQGYGKRPCQLLRIGLTTGRRVSFDRSIWGRVGQRPRTYCRHGGGILQRNGLLWVVEKNKLWLVNPSQPGSVLEARRVWRLKSPVRGSAVVANAGLIGMVPFQTRGPAYVHWFNIKRLLRPGVLDLAVNRKGRKQVGAVARRRIPTYVQGATVASGRLYLARSNLACGELVTPTGRRTAFVPGAEGIQFGPGNRRLWAVSESGAPPYARSRKPLTPAVASFGWERLVGAKSSKCSFRAR
jgi:hypothetical protein